MASQLVSILHPRQRTGVGANSQIVKDREAGLAAVHGVAKSLVTEQPSSVLVECTHAAFGFPQQ